MHYTQSITPNVQPARIYLAGDEEARRSVRVLTRDDVILWVVGLRASRHFPVIPATRRYLRLELGR